MTNKFEISGRDITSIRESITTIEFILLEHMYMILIRVKKLEQSIMENLMKGEYNKVQEDTQELKFIKRWDGTLEILKNQFFEHATVELLNNIIDRKPVKGNWSESFISTDVLREFRFSADFKADHPKAQVAKKLGAKLIS